MFSPCIRTESKDDKHFIETTACHLYLFPLSLSLALQSHFNEEDVRLADQGSDPNLTAVLRGLLSRSSSGCQPISRVRSHGLQYSKALCQCESMKRMNEGGGKTISAIRSVY